MARKKAKTTSKKKKKVAGRSNNGTFAKGHAKVPGSGRKKGQISKAKRAMLISDEMYATNTNDYIKHVMRFRAMSGKERHALKASNFETLSTVELEAFTLVDRASRGDMTAVTFIRREILGLKPGHGLGNHNKGIGDAMATAMNGLATEIREGTMTPEGIMEWLAINTPYLVETEDEINRLVKHVRELVSLYGYARTTNLRSKKAEKDIESKMSFTPDKINRLLAALSNVMKQFLSDDPARYEGFTEAMLVQIKAIYGDEFIPKRDLISDGKTETS